MFLNQENIEVANILHLRHGTSHSSHHIRIQRKLENAAESNHKITEYFEVLNQLEILIKENEALKLQLLASVNKVSHSKAPHTVHSMLDLLLECALENAGRKPEGRRYTQVIKELGYLIYSLGGLALYEILSCSENFPLPTVSTIRRMIYAEEGFIEGEFRIRQLKEFLTLHNLPFKVFLCEDATRVTGRIQYASKSNQVKGFSLPLDGNGLPKTGNFPATSATVMAQYFSDYPTSSSAYCIIAVPLKVNAPDFTLCMFGTNNKFKAIDVHNRLEWTKESLMNAGNFNYKSCKFR